MHVGSSPACADRLALAVDRARRYDTYLIGAGAPGSPTGEASFRTMLRSAGVVGAWRGIYGRSRLREMILGGMTQDVLENVTMPVLMAH